jgi:hypothetical protein
MLFLEAEGHDDAASDAEIAAGHTPGSKRSARTHRPHAREPGDLGGASSQQSGDTQLREGKGRKPQSQTFEESDAFIVAKKPGNSWVTPEDSVEQRDAADGECAR